MKQLTRLILSICLSIIIYFLIDNFSDKQYKYFVKAKMQYVNTEFKEVSKYNYEQLIGNDSFETRKDKLVNYNALFVAIASGIMATILLTTRLNPWKHNKE